ncbi:MAG: hypothetical protein LBL17_03705 [Coxiellaceae bacterium]|nr:hypothetical protein [Coxiellaceae bacterium]
MQQPLVIKNPRSRLSDFIPKKFKVWWKANISAIGGSPLYHTIIPATKNHYRLVLGAQPRKIDILRLSEEATECNRFPNRKAREVYIISMIPELENIFTDFMYLSIDSSNKELQLDQMVKVCFHRKPWFDHGILNLDIKHGEPIRNQTVRSMREFQEGGSQEQGLYQEFFISKEAQEKSQAIHNTLQNDRIFYCHCMAGKSRSFLEILAFLYFCPQKEKLFDYENWSSKDVERISARGLDKYLRDNPSCSEIAEFMKLQRPNIRTLINMDGDQSGLVGLMSLNKWAEDLKVDPTIIKKRDVKRRFVDTQNIGLMLKAPLDLSFRDPVDRAEQEKNLMSVYQAYKNEGINLLIAMIVPLSRLVNPSDYEKNFELNFKKLHPSEQARFAILLQGLENNPTLDLRPLYIAEYYAKIAVKKSRKLTAGDQVELLKTFRDVLGLHYDDVIKKIESGNKIDRYNAEVQTLRARESEAKESSLR